MAKQRCNKHPMYYEPCSICAEISKLEEQVEDRNAKTIELEAEINDLKRVMHHAEESAKKYAEQTCELKEELDREKEASTKYAEQAFDEHVELMDALETIDQMLKDNVKPERMNPSIRNRLFVQDLNNVRGFLLSYTFLHNTIVQGKDRLKSLEGVELKQWTLFLNEIEEVYERWVDLKNLLINDMSNSNWERMKREVDAIVKKIVVQVNHRNLGHWTLSEEGTVDVEYKVRPLVEKAVNTCINSAGTNSLTAYSREMLVKDLIRIAEEK